MDVLAVVPRGEIEHLIELACKGSALHRKYRLYLDLVKVATVPKDYEQRLTEVAASDFNRLRLFVLAPYDLALAKIERNIQRDRDNMKQFALIVPFDLDMLKSRYDKELRPYLGNPSREDLTLRLCIDSAEEERRV